MTTSITGEIMMCSSCCSSNGKNHAHAIANTSPMDKSPHGEYLMWGDTSTTSTKAKNYGHEKGAGGLAQAACCWNSKSPLTLMTKPDHPLIIKIRLT